MDLGLNPGTGCHELIIVTHLINTEIKHALHPFSKWLHWAPGPLYSSVIYIKELPRKLTKNPIKLRAHKGPVQGRAELQLFAAYKAKYKIFNI